MKEEATVFDRYQVVVLQGLNHVGFYNLLKNGRLELDTGNH